MTVVGAYGFDALSMGSALGASGGIIVEGLVGGALIHVLFHADLSERLNDDLEDSLSSSEGQLLRASTSCHKAQESEAAVSEAQGSCSSQESSHAQCGDPRARTQTLGILF